MTFNEKLEEFIDEYGMREMYQTGEIIIKYFIYGILIGCGLSVGILFYKIIWG